MNKLVELIDRYVAVWNEPDGPEVFWADRGLARAVLVVNMPSCERAYVELKIF